ncbi:CLUMA_CG014670, isoform A [Clunio marinus]|uniref:CLUMA_CG014670, isoform A n=1 Tax=Clunio marinus TaxID=568069 RepID=A0A1J1IPS9_9DIPT|nr:CLUMA_CG014670, isoform A [Clunio marinus]
MKDFILKFNNVQFSVVVSLIAISLIAVFLTLSTIVLVIVNSIYLIYFVIYLTAGILLIRSVKRRTYANMMFYMVLLVIGIIVSFLQLFSFSPIGVAIAVITLTLNIYIFICIYSLYDLFRNEELNRRQTTQGQSQQPSSFHTPTVVYLQNQEPNQQTVFQHPPTAPQLSPPVVYEK